MLHTRINVQREHALSVNVKREIVRETLVNLSVYNMAPRGIRQSLCQTIV